MGDSGEVSLETVLDVLRAHGVEVSPKADDGYLLVKSTVTRVIPLGDPVRRR